MRLLEISDMSTGYNAVPVVRDLNGLQSDPTWRLSTGLAVRF